MKQVEKINSKKYWDNRFNKDWVSNKGDDQSRFFSNVAKELIPNWLVEASKRDKLSVCDWGCAEGDGTTLLKHIFPKSKITGIDFSSQAIEKAKEKYSDIDFINVDLLKEDRQDLLFDIFFSSNTFEHFKDPYMVFDKVSQHAKKFVVILIPFEEDENAPCSEHFSSFRWGYFAHRHSGWSLVGFSAVDVSKREGSLWSGKQALVVYAKSNTLKDTKLDLVAVASALNSAGKSFSETDNQSQILQKAYKTEIEDLVKNEERLNGVIAIQKEQIADDAEKLNSKRYRLSVKVADALNGVLPHGSFRRDAIVSIIKLPSTIALNISRFGKKERTDRK